MPVDAHTSLVVLAAGLQALQTMIKSIERRIIAQHRSDEASKRLRSIPGIGIVGATAIAATVPDPKVFRSGRDFAAWIGIVPRQRFDRWQTEARTDLEARRPISKTHSGGRSPCGVEAGAPPTGEVSVGHKASRPQTVQGRSGGTCQQDGARCLGVAGQGWHLSSACTCGSGLTGQAMEDEVASARSRTAGVMTTLMRNGRDRRSGKPVKGHAILERFGGLRSADHIRASGHSGRIATGQASTRKQAGYMAAPERFAKRQIPLAPRAPSIHGP